MVPILRAQNERKTNPKRWCRLGEIQLSQASQGVHGFIVCVRLFTSTWHSWQSGTSCSLQILRVIGWNGLQHSSTTIPQLEAGSAHSSIEAVPVHASNDATSWSQVYHSQGDEICETYLWLLAIMSQVIFCKVLWFVLKKYSLKSLEVTCVPAGLGSLGMKLAQWPRSSPTSRGILAAGLCKHKCNPSKNFICKAACSVLSCLARGLQILSRQHKLQTLREFLRNSRACSAQMHKHGHFCWTTAKHEASYDSSINLTMDGGSGRICLRNVDKKCHHEAFLPGTLPIFAHSGGSFGWIPSAQLGIQAPMPQSLWVETTVTTEAKRPHCGSPTSQLHLRLLPERFDASVLMKSIFFGKKTG